MDFKVTVALLWGDRGRGCMPPLQEVGRVTFLSTADKDPRPEDLSLPGPLCEFPLCHPFAYVPSLNVPISSQLCFGESREKLETGL